MQFWGTNTKVQYFSYQATSRRTDIYADMFGRIINIQTSLLHKRVSVSCLLDDIHVDDFIRTVCH